MSSLDARLVHQINEAGRRTTELLRTPVPHKALSVAYNEAVEILRMWQDVAVVVNEGSTWICGRCEGAETLDHSRHCPERYANAEPVSEDDFIEQPEDPGVRAEDMTPELHYRAASQCLMDADTVADGSKTQRAYLKFAEVHAMLAANPLFAVPEPYKLRVGSSLGSSTLIEETERAVRHRRAEPSASTEITELLERWLRTANPPAAAPTVPDGLRLDTIVLAEKFSPTSVVHRVLARWLDYTQ